MPAHASCSVDRISDDEDLAPAEAAHVARALPSRRREFAAGRRCARAVLAGVGCPPVPIGRGALGEPRWPSGYSGSITHGSRFAAAIAWSLEVDRDGYGVDLVDEPDLNVFVEVARSILSEREYADLGALARDGRDLARRFSAKEAAIKVLSPALGCYVDFRELETRVRLDELIVSTSGGGYVATRSSWVANVLLTVATGPSA